MKKTALIYLLSFFFVLPLCAQIKVKTVDLNNEKLHVYPYPIETDGRKLVNIMIMGKDFKNIIRTETLENEMRDEPDYSASNFLKSKSNQSKILLQYKDALISKNTYSLIQKELTVLYSASIRLDKDITPPLDVLPDGKYVQYYSHFYYFDEQGVIQKDEAKVAGIFTIVNNLLDGEATWYHVDGAIIKQGHYSKGLKTGTWTYTKEEYRIPSQADEKQVLSIISGPKSLTSVQYQFKDGVENGLYESSVDGEIVEKGFYIDGEKSGEWFEYKKVKFPGEGEKKYYLAKHYTIQDYSNRVIDHRLNYRYIDNKNYVVSMSYYEGELSFPKQENFPYSASKLFALDKERFIGLELPEENDNDYLFDRNYISKAKLMDSIGYYSKYKDVYEEFYPNGQVRFRCQFDDGKWVKEDTIFYHTGKTFAVLEYNKDINATQQSFYDLNGTLFRVFVYDSIGEVSSTPIDLLSGRFKVKIDGLEVNGYEGDQYLIYENYDSIFKGIAVSHHFLKAWYNMSDTLVNQTVYYDAEKNQITDKLYSYTGKLISEKNYLLSDDFENYTYSEVKQFENLTMKSSGNAFYDARRRYQIEQEDSIKMARLYSLHRNYDLTTRDELLVNNVPYSGKFSFKKGAKFDAVISSKAIQIQIPNKYYNRLLSQEIEQGFFVNPSATIAKHKRMFNILEDNGQLNHALLSYFPFLNFVDRFDSYYDDYDYYEGYSDVSSLKKLPKNSYDQVYRIEGNFLDGKPSGVWKVYDSKGKLNVELRFENGELNGDVKSYNIAFKKKKLKESDEYYEYMDEDGSNGDIKAPSKDTHYLANTFSYKNGRFEGPYISYDWKGNIIEKENYKDGRLDGPRMNRNELATIKQNYLDGNLDGDVMAYLTLPKRDTLLAFQLKFKDGALQGESKAFHTNGKLAKRGFYLHNEPIDDYQAFDTLGALYHYVKFQYGFPVEEKIWEQNMLSVKYEFDWKDSIYFDSSDLTDVSSLNSILYSYDLYSGYDEPYLGRSSLVEKEEVKYHLTKYFPNDSISRMGKMDGEKKIGLWKFFDYEGQLLYTVNYYDTIIHLNDSIRFKSKGIYYKYDQKGELEHKSYLIERIQKYDCSHTDHYEVKQYYTIWEKNPQVGRMNGYTKNYYDTGTLQSEGEMKNGLPTGIWKVYDPNGKLFEVGEYVQGKRNGRWMKGDLSKSKYLGDICLNPNLPDIDKKIESMEKQLDINIRNFKLGEVKNSENYNLDLNQRGSEVYEETESPE